MEFPANAIGRLDSPSDRHDANHGLCLLAVSAVGFSLRRNSGLKWVLVILTFEGAVRVGLLVSLFGMAWRRL